MKRTHRAIITALLSAAAVAGAYAQIELVPAEHAVYDFLKRMQVRSLLDDRYTDVSLPYDRRTVGAMLVNVAGERDRLTRAELAALQRHLTEFSYEAGLPADERESLIGNGVRRLFSPRQKYLYRYEDETAAVSAHLLMSGELQRWDIDAVDESAVSLWRVGGGVRGTLGGWFGFSMHAVNGYVGGSRELGLRNIEVERTYKIDEPDSRFFDVTRGHVRAANEWAAVTVGRERLIQGNGMRRYALLVSDYAPKVDYVGLDLRYKRFFFTFFHGWILGDEVITENVEGTFVRTIPEKYVSFHRFGAFFFDSRLQVGVSEMIVYGGRGLEVAYLNPFLFFKSVEHSLRDRDKAMIAFDVQARPVRGLELYADLLIDDLAFERLGTDWYGNQLAWRLGGIAAPAFAGAADALLSVDYQRIRPYVYTHRITQNAFTHNGYPIGSPLGPNADMWDFRWRHLWSGRTETQVYGQLIRKGHNVTDAEGGLVRNVGGDIAVGYREGDSSTAAFLDGNLEKTRVFGISLQYEILHQFFILAGYERRGRDRRWSGQTFNEHFMFANIVISL
jgi:hypothetical protein